MSWELLHHSRNFDETFSGSDDIRTTTVDLREVMQTEVMQNRTFFPNLLVMPLSLRAAPIRCPAVSASSSFLFPIRRRSLGPSYPRSQKGQVRHPRRHPGWPSEPVLSREFEDTTQSAEHVRARAMETSNVIRNPLKLGTIEFRYRMVTNVTVYYTAKRIYLRSFPNEER